MKRYLLPVLLMLGLAGCETMGVNDKSATIEDRGTQPSKTTPSTATPRDGAETGGLADGQQGIDATQLGADPRKDPSSPLSKRSVYFDFDSFVVRDEYRPTIEAHSAYLKKDPKARAILQGNADSRGSREYNLALGQKRAEAVRRAMTVLGVSDDQLEAVSFGEEKPRATGETEEAYAENRRTDIVYGDE